MFWDLTMPRKGAKMKMVMFMKNSNIKEKKVYKIDKVLGKKVGIGILIISLLVVLIIFGSTVGKRLYLNTWKWYEVEDYNFSIKLPRAYKSFETSEDGFGLNSSAFTSEYLVEVEEKYVSKEAEVVYSGGNIINGISLMIQCLYTEKTTKTLDEISEGNYILTTIYYEDNYNIGELQKEYVQVLGSDAIRNIVDISNDDVTKTLITYLIPLEDREITITFLGKKESVMKSMEEIEKIISQMK